MSATYLQAAQLRSSDGPGSALSRVRVESTAECKAGMSGPHDAVIGAVAASQAAGGTLQPELFEVQRQCYLCSALVEKIFRCGACKAIIYCSQACQQTDWTAGRPTTDARYAQALPHKKQCASYKEQMRRHAEVGDDAAFFPWLTAHTTRSGFPRRLVLAVHGVLGETVGYWSMPNQRGSHAEGPHATLAFDYNVMLGAEALPTDLEGWRLPESEVPALLQLTAEAQPARPARPLASWAEYYEWRGLPASSIACLLLEFPLTLLGLLYQPHLLAPGKEVLTVHVVGVERELLFLPLFAELSLLLPPHLTELRLVFFGKQVVRAWAEAPESGWGKTAAAAAAAAASSAKGGGGEEGGGGCEDGPRRAAEVFRYAPPAGGCAVSVSLETASGAWQEAVLDPQTRAWRYGGGVPDLLWGPNAGVSSYPEWQEVVGMCAFVGVPFAVSEYCEASLASDTRFVIDPTLQQSSEAAAQQGRRTARTGDVQRWLNPFHGPGQRQISICDAPNLSNGFCLLIPGSASFAAQG